jgi:hypothetical protein
MSHARQKIRDAVVLLITGLTTTGSRVFDTRLYNLDPDVNLPGLVVYTQNETSERSDFSPNNYSRELDVVIEGYVETNSTVENTLDTISLEVENVLGANPLLNNTATTSELTQTEIEFDVMGERPIGIIRLTLSVTYYTLSTDNSTNQ